MSVVDNVYSQATLTFLDTDNIGLDYGVDTQGDFEHYDFTLPTQASQTQPSQLTQHDQGVCVWGGGGDSVTVVKSTGIRHSSCSYPAYVKSHLLFYSGSEWQESCCF